MGLLLMTYFTLQEALRRRLFLAILSLSFLLLGLFFLVLKFIVQQITNTSHVAGTNIPLALFASGIFLSVPAVWMVYLIIGILTIFLTANIIAGEIEAGTFAIIVPKPLHRSDIVMGKWLGYTIILSIYTAFLFSAFLGIIYWQTGYWPDQFWNALGLLELVALSLLSFTTLGSVLFSTTVNGAVALILFAGAPLVNFINSIMHIISLTQDVNIGPNNMLQNTMTIIDLIIPADALWHGTSYLLLPSSVLSFLPSQNISIGILQMPIINGQPISTGLLIWIILYCLILPALAAWRFQKRDL